LLGLLGGKPRLEEGDGFLLDLARGGLHPVDHSDSRYQYRLEEDLGVANVELTADDLAEIERNASAITIEGERYPPQLMATTGR
jgi:hypothetical protein